MKYIVIKVARSENHKPRTRDWGAVGGLVCSKGCLCGCLCSCLPKNDGEPFSARAPYLIAYVSVVTRVMLMS